MVGGAEARLRSGRRWLHALTLVTVDLPRGITREKQMFSHERTSRLWPNSLPHVMDDVPGASPPGKPKVFMTGKKSWRTFSTAH